MGDIKRESWFPTHIWSRDIDGSEQLNSQLLSAIRGWQEEDPKGVAVSNSLGWHSQYNLHRRGEFRGIVDAINDTVAALGRDIGVVETVEPIIYTSWANVSPKHAANRMHVHPDVYLSGVYYVQVPKGCGKICFRDPRPQVEGLIFPVPRGAMWSEVTYEPKAGRMFLFPAWLPHEVLPNMSNLDRISIAFNITYRSRKS